MLRFKASVLVLGFLCLMAMLWGCIPQEQKEKEEVAKPVKTLEVQESTQPVTRAFPGKVSPVRETKLSFRVGNQLQALEVDKGDFVKPGEVIARLDPRDFELAVRNLQGSLEEARANLEAMETGARTEDVIALESRLRAAQSAREEWEQQYARYKDLFEQGAVAKADLDQVRTAYAEAKSKVRDLEMELQKALMGARKEDIRAMEARISSLQARLDEARTSLEDTRLEAPFPGYIADKYVQDHENVSRGQPIVKLQDLSLLEVVFGLPEQFVIQKDRIKEIHCLLDSYPGLPFPARIKEISPHASPETMSYAATAVLAVPEEVKVLPSMAAQVHIGFSPPETHEEHVSVPQSALYSRDGEISRVWVLDTDTSRVQSRQVRTGDLTSRGVQVLSGLKPGEWIVTAGAPFLEEGQKVRPLD